ncbi:cofG, partial [Symbiodinium sp. CCMP2592]
MLVVQVVNMITSCRKRNTTEDRTTFSQSILDTPVCQDAFGRLLDGRFLKQTRQYRKMQGSTEKQQAVVEFLTEMHATVAEYMPEANRARDTASPVPKTTESQNGNDTVPIGLRFRKRTGKRPRKSVSMNFGKDTTALKMLPPGTFTGYLALLNARREGKDKISLKMFNEVWAESFGTRLAIRPVSRHALCSVCLRHKLIIRKCGADEVARDIQCRQYEQHLKLQYKDRTCYWEKRGLARLRSLQGNGLYPLSLIRDGADHSKFACPRSGVFSGKDFSSLHRPTMDLVGCLLHGQSACLALSHPRLAKDSSYSTELLYHMLHRVSSRVDLRQAELFLQADNTTRE